MKHEMDIGANKYVKQCPTSPDTSHNNIEQLKSFIVVWSCHNIIRYSNNLEERIHYLARVMLKMKKRPFYTRRGATCAMSISYSSPATADRAQRVPYSIPVNKKTPRLLR